MFSRRTSWELAPNALARALAARRAAGGQLVDLTITNPTAVGLVYPNPFYAALVDAESAAYEPEPLGLASAREEIASYYRGRGCACAARSVWLTASTSEAFAQLFALLCDPGDVAFVPRPGYPLLEYLAGLADVRLRSYPLAYDGGWRVDLEALHRLVTAEPRARLLVCTAPGNPTGAFLSRGELAAIDALCAGAGLGLVVDEVFAEFPLRPVPERTTCALGERASLTFVLSGLSKLALLPQWKLGFGAMCGPAERVEPALERLAVIADSFLSVSTPVQLALPRILKAAPELRARALERVRANLAALRAALAGGAGSVLEVEAGWSAIVRLPRLGDEADEAFALGLLEREGVLLHPGAFYELDGCHAVVSLLGPPGDFARGAAALAREVARRAV